MGSKCKLQLSSSGARPRSLRSRSSVARSLHPPTPSRLSLDFSSPTTAHACPPSSIDLPPWISPPTSPMPTLESRHAAATPATSASPVASVSPIASNFRGSSHDAFTELMQASVRRLSTTPKHNATATGGDWSMSPKRAASAAVGGGWSMSPKRTAYTRGGRSMSVSVSTTSAVGGGGALAASRTPLKNADASMSSSEHLMKRGSFDSKKISLPPLWSPTTGQTTRRASTPHSSTSSPAPKPKSRKFCQVCWNDNLPTGAYQKHRSACLFPGKYRHICETCGRLFLRQDHFSKHVELYCNPTPAQSAAMFVAAACPNPRCDASLPRADLFRHLRAGCTAGVGSTRHDSHALSSSSGRRLSDAELPSSLGSAVHAHGFVHEHAPASSKHNVLNAVRSPRYSPVYSHHHSPRVSPPTSTSGRSSFSLSGSSSPPSGLSLPMVPASPSTSSSTMSVESLSEPCDLIHTRPRGLSAEVLAHVHPPASPEPELLECDARAAFDATNCEDNDVTMSDAPRERASDGSDGELLRNAGLPLNHPSLASHMSASSTSSFSLSDMAVLERLNVPGHLTRDEQLRVEHAVQAMRAAMNSLKELGVRP